jgi:hypothetical protein
VIQSGSRDEDFAAVRKILATARARAA